MKTWLLKSCPKCGGDMHMEKDLYGWYTECLQCGRLTAISSAWEGWRYSRDGKINTRPRLQGVRMA